MNRVPVAETRLDDYVGIVPDDTIDSIQTLARQTKGLRYVHVNATPAGGGVAEILKSMIPLMRAVGIDGGAILSEPS